VFKKTAKEYGMEKKGKVLTKQGCLADPKKEVPHPLSFRSTSLIRNRPSPT
jgi:hypothetical protein